jgi:hypothetical protein
LESLDRFAVYNPSLKCWVFVSKRPPHLSLVGIARFADFDALDSLGQNLASNEHQDLGVQAVKIIALNIILPVGKIAVEVDSILIVPQVSQINRQSSEIIDLIFKGPVINDEMSFVFGEEVNELLCFCQEVKTSLKLSIQNMVNPFDQQRVGDIYDQIFHVGRGLQSGLHPICRCDGLIQFIDIHLVFADLTSDFHLNSIDDLQSRHIFSSQFQGDTLYSHEHKLNEWLVSSRVKLLVQR